MDLDLAAPRGVRPSGLQVARVARAFGQGALGDASIHDVVEGAWEIEALRAGHVEMTSRVVKWERFGTVPGIFFLG
jgi:hypothetical protein